MAPAAVNFILPGYSDRETRRRAKLAQANIASTVTNPRNTEDRTYSLWHIQCEALVMGRHNFLVNPQYRLWYKKPSATEETVELGGDGGDTAVSEVASGSVAGAEGATSTLTEESEDVGSTTLDTITSLASTTPGRLIVELISDFAITRLDYRDRQDTPGSAGPSIKIRFEGVLILIENKRAASRRLQGRSYLLDAERYVHLARTDAVQQAAILFHKYPKQQSVILIAASALYWSCRIIDKLTAMALAEDDYVPSFDDESDYEGSDIGEEDTNCTRDFLGSDDELDLIPRVVVPVEDEAKILEPLQLVSREEELSLPTAAWSGLLELDTQPSAQMWFIIYRRLQDVAADRSGVNG